MRLKIIFLFVFIIFVNLSARAQQIEWLKDYEQAAALARTSGKPLLLDFSAEWCSPCKVMEREFWTRADVIEAAKKFVAVKIDYDKSIDLNRRYNISGVPNVTATDAWGVALVAHRGFSLRSVPVILDKLNSVPDDFTEIKSASENLIKNKNDLAALYKIAEFYKKREYFYQTLDFYERVFDLETDTAKREDALLNVAFGSVRASQPDKAIETFENFRKVFPQSSQTDAAIYGEIYALTRKGKTAEANRFYEELKMKFPKSDYTLLAEKALNQFSGK